MTSRTQLSEFNSGIIEMLSLFKLEPVEPDDPNTVKMKGQVSAIISRHDGSLDFSAALLEVWDTYFQELDTIAMLKVTQAISEVNGKAFTMKNKKEKDPFEVFTATARNLLKRVLVDLEGKSKFEGSTGFFVNIIVICQKPNQNGTNELRFDFHNFQERKRLFSREPETICGHLLSQVYTWV